MPMAVPRWVLPLCKALHKGKTHIAIALGYEAYRQGFKIKSYTAAGLINELLAAQQKYRLNRLEKQWLIPHVVILDELGYIPFSKTGAELLFQFCSFIRLFQKILFNNKNIFYT
jgi:DNA replication protein DnaC